MYKKILLAVIVGMILASTMHLHGMNIIFDAIAASNLELVKKCIHGE